MIARNRGRHQINIFQIRYCHVFKDFTTVKSSPNQRFSSKPHYLTRSGSRYRTIFCVMKLRTFPKIKEVLNFGLTKNWPLYAISPSCAGRMKAASFTPTVTPLPSFGGGVNSIPTFGGGIRSPPFSFAQYLDSFAHSLIC